MQILDVSKLRRNIEATVLPDLKSGRVGGVALAVSQYGKICYENYLGNTSIGIPVAEDTMFRLASMTKPVTAVAVLLLKDRGLINLDQLVEEFLPEYNEMQVGRVQDGKMEILGKAESPITIRQLLTHSSGLGSGPVGDEVGAHFPVRERVSLEKVVGHYAKHPLDFQPGTAQAYSALYAFDVLARIVEITTGEAYASFLEREILKPLGMMNTTFAPSKEQWERMIPMHNYEGGAGKAVDFPEGSLFEGIPTCCCCAGAGLASTLQDYMRFAEMLLHGGRPLLQEHTVREMATPQLPDAIMHGQEVWGLGVRVIVSEAYRDLPCGAFGWSGAYGTHFWVDPVNQITAVYMKNSRYDGGAGAYTSRRFEQAVAESFRDNE